jgi:hypothetical protein
MRSAKTAESSIEHKRNYIQWRYRWFDEEILNNLEQCHTVEDLNKADELEDLLDILTKEEVLPENIIPTAQNVIDNREFLLSLRAKTVSYLTFGFIPSLLRILENDISKKYPDTEILTSVNMELSKDGKERWQEAIHKQIEFTVIGQPL